MADPLTVYFTSRLPLRLPPRVTVNVPVPVPSSDAELSVAAMRTFAPSLSLMSTRATAPAANVYASSVTSVSSARSTPSTSESSIGVIVTTADDWPAAMVTMPESGRMSAFGAVGLIVPPTEYLTVSAASSGPLRVNRTRPVFPPASLAVRSVTSMVTDGLAIVTSADGEIQTLFASTFSLTSPSTSTLTITK